MRREQESRTDLRVTLLVVHVSFCRDVQIFFLFKKKNLTRLLTALLKSTGIQNRKLRHERKFTNVYTKSSHCMHACVLACVRARVRARCVCVCVCVCVSK